jgi:Tol biopolymer transport system component
VGRIDGAWWRAVARNRRRSGLGAIAAVAGLALAGCSGHTTGATQITTTSATLTAVGSCSSGESCEWYYEYWRANQPRSSGFRTPISGPVNAAVRNVKLSVRISGLTANTAYRWVICGSGNKSATFSCVGPAGRAGSTTADPPPDYQTFVTHSAGGRTGIVYESRPDSGASGVFVMNGDGTNQTRLTTAPTDGYDSFPAWSPDGTKIAFTRRLSGSTSQIYVMSATGASVVPLTNNPDGDEEPAWSPDGTKIAFVSDSLWGNSQIDVMNPDGTGVRPLTTASNSQYDDGPTWSPDSSELAFTRDSPGSTAQSLMTMNADGSGQRTIRTGTDRYPAWSRVGTRIADISGAPAHYGLYVLNADGSSPQQLHQAILPFSWRVSWSADSSKIAFTDAPTPGDEGDIFSTNAANGSNPADLTHTTNAEETNPDWSPIP